MNADLVLAHPCLPFSLQQNIDGIIQPLVCTFCKGKPFIQVHVIFQTWYVLDLIIKHGMRNLIVGLLLHAKNDLSPTIPEVT